MRELNALALCAHCDGSKNCFSAAQSLFLPTQYRSLVLTICERIDHRNPITHSIAWNILVPGVRKDADRVINRVAPVCKFKNSKHCQRLGMVCLRLTLQSLLLCAGLISLSHYFRRRTYGKRIFGNASRNHRASTDNGSRADFNAG